MVYAMCLILNLPSSKGYFIIKRYLKTDHFHIYNEFLFAPSLYFEGKHLTIYTSVYYIICLQIFNNEYIFWDFPSLIRERR